MANLTAAGNISAATAGKIKAKARAKLGKPKKSVPQRDGLAKHAAEINKRFK